MGLNHRLVRLERRARAASRGACSGCGHAPDAPLDIRVIGPEVRSRIDEASSADEQPGDRCGTCRRKVVYRIPSPAMARVAG